MLAYPVAMIVVGAAATYVLALFAATLIAAAGFPLPPANKRIGCIDGMRGFLALSVLIHHFIIWMQVVRLGGGWAAPTINAFNQIGAGCVALFFMTTGFVFYPRILAGFRACSWPAIYTTRLFRIVPLVAVSVAIITVLIAVRTGRLPGRDYATAAASWISAWDEPPLLGYPDSGRLNAYVLWSLWYEWLFYLFVLPACALAMDLVRRRLPTWTVPLVLGFGAIAARLAGAPGLVLMYLPVFAIGMLAYELQRYERIAGALRAPWVSVVSALCLVVGMTCAPTPYTGVLPLFGVVFICIACGNSMGGLLKTKGALVLGECSYAIYLLHGIVLSLLFVDAARFTARIATDELPLLSPLAGAAVVLVASLVYRGIERPSIAAGIMLARLWTDRRLRRDSAELEVAP